MSEEKTIIEINGVKLEVDLRQAKRVDNIRVGTRVKVLCKPKYGEQKVHHGVVIGFEPFESLPTIIVAYVKLEYNSADVAFLYFNKNTEDAELVVAIDDDQLNLERDEVERWFNKEIEKRKVEIRDLYGKLEYFRSKFGQFFAPVELTPKDLECPSGDE